MKQGAKLVVKAEAVIEELSTPVRAALLQVEKPEAEQRNLLAAGSRGVSEKNFRTYCTPTKLAILTTWSKIPA